MYNESPFNNAVVKVNLLAGLTGFDMVDTRNNVEFQRLIAIKGID